MNTNTKDYLYSIHGTTKLAVRNSANTYSDFTHYEKIDLQASLDYLMKKAQSYEDIDNITQLFCHLYLHGDSDERLDVYTKFVEFHEKITRMPECHVKEMWIEFSKFFHKIYQKHVEPLLIQSNRQKVTNILNT